MTKTVSLIAEIAERTAESAVEASLRGDSLAELAQRLQHQVGHFALADTAET